MPAAPSPSPPPPSVAGFSPGGAVPHGYSYLSRSHSLLTPSRRAAPRFTPGDADAAAAARAPPRPTHSARSSSGGGSGSLVASADESSPGSTALSRADEASPGSTAQHATAARPALALRLAGQTPASPQPALSRSNSTPLHSPANARLQWSRRERGDADEDKPPAATSQQQLLAAVEALPDNPKLWLPSQVALYLAHALALLPAPIIADLSAFVRGTSISGRAFLRLQESDLAERGMNQRWRRVIIAAARRLRRDCLRSRIWADGDCEWPRTEDAAETQQPGDQPGAGTQRALKQQTLKRMRDRAAVREMIQSFESPTLSELDEEGFVALPGRLRSSSSISSLRSDASSPRRSASSELAGTDGLVRQRQESFDSLRDASAAQAPAKPWLAQLTHEELQAAGESLDESSDERGDDERDDSVAERNVESELARNLGVSTHASSPEDVLADRDADAEPEHTHARDLSASTQGSMRSSESGGSLDEPQTPPPIDTDLPQTQAASTEPSPAFLEETTPASKLEEPVADAGVERSAAFRTRLAAGAKTNLYRASTYDAEELEALGITLDEEDTSLGRFDTCRRIQSPELEQAVDEIVIDDSLPPLNARMADGTLGRSSMGPRRARAGGLLDLFSPAAPPEGAGLDAPQEGATDAASDVQPASDVQAATGIAADAEPNSDAQPASDAELAPNPASAPDVPLVDDAAPATDAAPPTNAASATDAAPATDAVPLTDAVFATDAAPETLLVPITTLAPAADGKGSVRQRSMVMVDRRRFESLARRALLVDDMAHQLSVLERLTGPDAQAPSDELRTSRRERTRHALDDVFAPPADAAALAADADAHADALLEEDARSGKGWLRSLLDVGAIPSYAIGLGAGVGFVVVTEVLGLAARRR